MKECLKALKYLISQDGNISNVYYHNYMKIKINSDDNLPLKSTNYEQGSDIY